MVGRALIIVCFNLVSASGADYNVNDVPKMQTSKPTFCRDRTGYLSLPLFHVTSCAMCYFYLFQKKGSFTVSESGVYLRSKEAPPLKVVPRVANKTSLDVVCSRMTHADCVKWTACCADASACCHSNVRFSSGDAEENSYCQPVWDGFSCVRGAAAGEDVSLPCPWYIAHSVTADEHAHRKCTDNGTWWRDEEGREWTDYSTCIHLDLEFYRIVKILFMSINSISACMLTTAIIIFLSFRQLRIQQRIKIHVNLCLSLLLSSVVFVLWDSLVYYNRLVHREGDSLLYTHKGYCTALNVTTRVLRTTTFFWMFCEGFYLLCLLKKAFKPIKNMAGFYVCGWGLPVAVVGCYTGVRLNLYGNRRCWISEAGAVEWIIFAPTIACIGVNLIFLFLILHVLLTQLKVHPNEPNTYRRAIKAMFILIPLFGLHQFFIMYTPNLGDKGYKIYQVVTPLIVNSQGFLVALIFCFMNGEVIANLKSAWTKWRAKPLTSRRPSRRSSSMFTLYSQRSAQDFECQAPSCYVNEISDQLESPSDFESQRLPSNQLKSVLDIETRTTTFGVDECTQERESATDSEYSSPF